MCVRVHNIQIHTSTHTEVWGGLGFLGQFGLPIAHANGLLAPLQVSFRHLVLLGVIPGLLVSLCPSLNATLCYHLLTLLSLLLTWKTSYDGLSEPGLEDQWIPSIACSSITNEPQWLLGFLECLAGSK